LVLLGWATWRKNAGKEEGCCTEVEGCAAEVDVKVAGEKFAVESVVDGKTEIQLQVSG